MPDRHPNIFNSRAKTENSDEKNYKPMKINIKFFIIFLVITYWFFAMSEFRAVFCNLKKLTVAICKYFFCNMQITAVLKYVFNLLAETTTYAWAR